jgi:hypothetical protein
MSLMMLGSSVPDPDPPYPHILGLPDPDPVRGMDPIRIRIRILLSASKNSKKNLDSYCLLTSFGIFMKNDVNVPSKRNMQKTF